MARTRVTSQLTSACTAMRGVRAAMRSARVGVRRLSTMPAMHGELYPNSLHWVKAGCPSPPPLAGSSAPKASIFAQMDSMAPGTLERVKEAATDGPGALLFFGAGAVFQGVRLLMYDPLKENGLVVIEGRIEVKPEEEEEEEEIKFFEISDDGKRYGGAFVSKGPKEDS